MKQSYRFYRGCYRIARALLSIVYGFNIQGKENIPDGAAMICANHSNLIDPFFIAFAFGIKSHLHVIAKAELYKIPILSTVLKKLGTIRVDRDILDVSSVKRTLSYFNINEKVAIFPEGTRKPEKNAVTAKTGAVKIADHARVPIVPVFIPRKKPLFSKIHIVIGEPYYIEKQNIRHSPDEYSRFTEALMNKIEALNPKMRKNSTKTDINCIPSNKY